MNEDGGVIRNIAKYTAGKSHGIQNGMVSLYGGSRLLKLLIEGDLERSKSV